MGALDLINRAERLRAMTESRGCSAPEAEVAALKLGRMIQQHPEIQLTTAITQQQRTHYRPWTYDDDDEEEDVDEDESEAGQPLGYRLGIVLIAKETDKAFFVRPHKSLGKLPCWIPKSQITAPHKQWAPDMVVDLWVSDWFANKRGWR